MAVSTFLRGWQDFDYILVAQFALFLFSATFAPADGYPWAARLALQVTPLYHGVHLLRGLTTGMPGWGLLADVGYLLVLAVAGLVVAGRRMSLLLCR